MRVLDNSDTVHSQEFVPAAKAQANNNSIRNALKVNSIIETYYIL